MRLSLLITKSSHPNLLPSQTTASQFNGQVYDLEADFTKRCVRIAVRPNPKDERRYRPYWVPMEDVKRFEEAETVALATPLEESVGPKMRKAAG